MLLALYIHGLHHVAEQILSQFSEGDLLIANVKQTFVKTPQKRDLYFMKFP